MATYSNYLIHKILLEAGLPPSVIQFVPGNPPEVVQQCIDHREFGGLHFTGSTQVFKGLWGKIGANLDKYRGYPRVVGETGTSFSSLSANMLICRRKELPLVPPICRYRVRCHSSYPSRIRILWSKMFSPRPMLRSQVNVGGWIP
jgi:hypothetical protein